MQKEIFKPVTLKNFESIYEISNYGTLRSKDRWVYFETKGAKAKRFTPGVIHGGKIDKYGYKVVNLTNKKYDKHTTVHRLVALHFIPKVKGKHCINHKDCNKLNNYFENLEWCTPKENNKHATENNLWNPARGIKHHNAKLTEQNIKQIRELSKQKVTGRELCKRFNVCEATISGIIHGKRWAHI